MAKHSFKVINGCLNLCQDEYGKLYKIPNFCINLPHFELELLKDEGYSDNEIIICVFDVKNVSKYSLKLKSNTKGRELIKDYVEKNNIDLSRYKVKILYGGGIIQENETLYQHRVKDGYNIQIVVIPII